MGSSSSKYLRLKRKVTLANDDKYKDRVEARTRTDKITVTRYKRIEATAISGGSTDVEIGEFGNISKIVLTNLDKTHYIEVQFKNDSNGALNNNYVRLLPEGQADIGSGITPTTDISLTTYPQTESAVCLIEVFGTV